MKILHLSDLHVRSKFKQLRAAADSTRTRGSVDAPKDPKVFWTPAETQFKGTTFDFIVISGDIAWGAESKEYDWIGKFIEYLSETYLGKNRCDRSRVILVPGNHDVLQSNSKQAYEEIGKIADMQVCAKIVGKSLGPGSMHRLEMCASGEYKIHAKVNNGFEKKYASRFKNFQNFYNKFYSKSTTIPQKQFDLLAPLEQGQDYSLHVFDKERVIFVGLNSCVEIDAYYNGAGFNRAALDNARKDIMKIQAAGGPYLLIGIWHHAASAKKGRSDYLDLDDLASAQSIGLQIGLHGHTHDAERRDIETRIPLTEAEIEAYAREKKKIEELKQRIIVLGTGSLNADHSESPETISNQFSVIDIPESSTKLILKIYNRVKMQLYEPKHEIIFRVPSSPNKGLGNHVYQPPLEVRQHTSTWNVDNAGIAIVDVRFQDLDLHDTAQIPLAPGSPRYGLANYQDACKYHRIDDISTVETERLSHNREDSHILSKHLEPGKYTDFSWAYRVSNQVVLAKCEFTFREERLGEKFSDSEMIAHVVTFPTWRLILEVNLPRVMFGCNEIISVKNVRCVVEKPSIKYAHLGWVRESSKKVDILAGGENGPVRISCQFERPHVGYRYSILYEPTARGRVMSKSAEFFLERFTAACRRKPRNDFDDATTQRNLHLPEKTRDGFNTFDGVILTQLARAFGETIPQKCAGDNAEGDQANQFDPMGQVEPPKGIEIVGWFWCAKEDGKKRKKLRVCFGNVAPSEWDNRIAYGEGLEGHAFRFNHIIAWYRDDLEGNGHGVINTMVNPECYSWMICVPVQPTEGPAIGVVSIAHVAPPKTDANVQPPKKPALIGELERFSKLAANRLSGQPKMGEAAVCKDDKAAFIEATTKALNTVVVKSFWEAVANSRERLKGYPFDDTVIDFAASQVGEVANP